MLEDHDKWIMVAVLGVLVALAFFFVGAPENVTGPSAGPKVDRNSISEGLDVEAAALLDAAGKAGVTNGDN